MPGCNPFRILIAALLVHGAAPSLWADTPLPADTGEYRGRARELQVALPRMEETTVRVDGVLDEGEWARAAQLTEFTQFQPAEGAAASERTEVRLFYTPEALYVGVRAHAQDPSRVRATLADRDNIDRDDQVQLLLDTFLDRRRAYALMVNPLGVQQDGIYSESGGGGRRGGGDEVDTNPDFIYQSRGRLTAEGYEVELRIPFKSLKYAGSDVQSWGVNVVRRIAASGAEETWAPVSRANPSRLAQSGTLTGIQGLRPGRLFEANPVLTGRRLGEMEDGHFVRGDFEPDFGANLKYGLTPNLTLDVTYNPDFSQVEADAGQITTNERFAIFFPEKRPFFLEGANIFAMEEQLVYTRAIVNPVAGAKVTGKVGGMTVGYLGAVDESPLSAFNPDLAPEPGRALFNIARLQRDVGAGSVLGAVFTGREAPGQFNRVVGVDGKIRMRRLYAVEFQAANSWTQRWTSDQGGAQIALRDGESVAVAQRSEAGHLLQAALDRTGRSWGFLLRARDVPSDFRAQSGFIRRRGVTEFFGANRLTWYGRTGAALESWTTRVMAQRIYGGRDFWQGGGPEEGSLRLWSALALRGNNRLQLSLQREFYILDPEDYADYRLVDAAGRVVRGSELIGQRVELGGLHGANLEARSSYFKAASLGVQVGVQETPIFVEGTRGRQWSAGVDAELRPTDALRVEADVRYARILRQRDGSLYSEAVVPRLKLEYQLNRAMFVRALGQYSVEEVDLLRTPDGAPYLADDGAPFRVRGGQWLGRDLLQTNPLRVDLLYSYQPSPGTVVFVGYGREMNDRGAYRFSPLEPRADGLFFKVSYLFRS